MKTFKLENAQLLELNDEEMKEIKGGWWFDLIGQGWGWGVYIGRWDCSYEPPGMAC